MKKITFLFFSILLVTSCSAGDESFVQTKNFIEYLSVYKYIPLNQADIGGKTTIVIGFDADYGYSIDPEKLRQFQQNESLNRNEIAQAHSEFEEQRQIDRQGRRTSRGEDAADAAVGIAAGIGCLASHAKEENAKRLIRYQNSLNERIVKRYNLELNEIIQTHIQKTAVKIFTNSGLLIDPSKIYSLKSFPDNPESSDDGVVKNYDGLKNQTQKVLQLHIKMIYYEYDRYSPAVNANPENKVVFTLTAMLLDLKAKAMLWRNFCVVGVKLKEMVNTQLLHYNFDILTRGRSPILDKMFFASADILIAGMNQQLKMHLRERTLLFDDLSHFVKVVKFPLLTLKRENNIENDLRVFNMPMGYR